ncbi:hypothetical protein RJ639_026456, partial [Escallonia herrerae]
MFGFEFLELAELLYECNCYCAILQIGYVRCKCPGANISYKAVGMLRRKRGHLVVMSSAAGKTPAPGQAVYSATKFALNGYFHTLRSELCRKGIKVTVVCPGPIKTANAPGTSTSEERASAEKRVPSERCAELTIIAASHGLKEVWISYQCAGHAIIIGVIKLSLLKTAVVRIMPHPVLAVMYLVQYMPTIGYWLIDK